MCKPWSAREARVAGSLSSTLTFSSRRICFDAYSAVSGTLATKRPNSIGPGVELNSSALLMVIRIRPGAIRLYADEEPAAVPTNSVTFNKAGSNTRSRSTPVTF